MALESAGSKARSRRVTFCLWGKDARSRVVGEDRCIQAAFGKEPQDGMASVQPPQSADFTLSFSCSIGRITNSRVDHLSFGERYKQCKRKVLTPAAVSANLAGASPQQVFGLSRFTKSLSETTPYACTSLHPHSPA